MTRLPQTLSRRRLKMAGVALLGVCGLCFGLAWERNEAQARDAESAAAVFRDLPGVEREVAMPLISKVAVTLGVLAGAAGLGCVLLGLQPPAGRDGGRD
ncbi:MAG: hypothetical protein JXQ71_02750 [Verrucomicrobia bacterium]|nr:hypothetical protein [Verrucomicrobiota bacterium]